MSTLSETGLRLGRFLIGAALAALTMIPVGEFMHSARVGFDPVFGGGPMPGKRVVCRVEGSGSALYTEHNVRRERLATPDEHPTILVMGDSITEAIQVKDHETYTYRLEELLRASGIPATVLNAGVSGRSMADYVGLAEKYERVFRPDWVVVQVAWWDFKDALDPHLSPHFCTNASAGRLELVSLPVPRRYQAERFQALVPGPLRDFCTFAYPIYRMREFSSWMEGETPWFHAPAKGSPPQQPCLPIQEELEMLNECWHGRLTLFLVSTYKPSGRSELDPPEQQIDSLARRMGLSIARLDQGFASLPKGVAPRGFANSGYNYGHLNAWGHRIAAEVLAAELKRVAATNGLF